MSDSGSESGSEGEGEGEAEGEGQAPQQPEAGGSGDEGSASGSGSEDEEEEESEGEQEENGLAAFYGAKFAVSHTHNDSARADRHRTLRHVRTWAGDAPMLEALSLSPPMP